MAEFMFQNVAYRATVYRTGVYMYVNEATRRTKQSFMCHDGTRLPMYITMHVGTSFDTTLPSPRLMQIPLLRNSTTARFGNQNQIFT
jgi:hypothetical protein